MYLSCGGGGGKGGVALNKLTVRGLGTSVEHVLTEKSSLFQKILLSSTNYLVISLALYFFPISGQERTHCLSLGVGFIFLEDDLTLNNKDKKTCSYPLLPLSASRHLS